MLKGNFFHYVEAQSLSVDREIIEIAEKTIDRLNA